jgi:predicted SnoaL-like aldol condensation-catalyzing enzyme
MNKDVIIKFYNALFISHDLSAIDKYIDEKVYIQHNPTVADGREAFKTAAKSWFAGRPTKSNVVIERASAEGDLVWLHVRDVDNNQAVVDIFRLDAGKIVEHWDVIQAIPAPAHTAHKHPMF